MKNRDEQKIIRKYLLGDLKDEAIREPLELRLMTDDEYFEEIGICEDELIDDYLSQKLSPFETQNFDKYFLITNHRREKLEFARSLKSHLATLPPRQKPAVKKPFFKFNWQSKLIYAPALTFFVLLLAGLIFWYWWFWKQSGDNDALVLLKREYKQNRPVQARISGFDYAPLNETLSQNTRGQNKGTNEKPIPSELEKQLIVTVEKDGSVKNLQTLGKYYLAEKRFTEALEQFEKARQINPNNAELESDISAVWLESGKATTNPNERDKQLKAWNNGLEASEKAISLNPNLLDAYFNRALCLEYLKFSVLAKEAWEKYLELDKTSPWAEEAKKHLEKLNGQKSQMLSGEEVETAFLQAMKQQNSDEAWRLLSRFRTFNSEKYLPVRLAQSYVNSDKKKMNF
jgi:tetratricopeptide (TPR) repeat protein